MRALAIALVLLAHAAAAQAGFTGWQPPEWLLRSGVYGVELFFVLSGYLIGGILLRMAALRPGWRGWLVFMLRRWLRTLPLYFLWLAVLALAWPPADDLPGHLLRYATLTQNLWRTMPDDGWFAVSWSLTIEEWFYLGFSAVLLGASALSRRAGVAWLAIGLFLAGPLAARLWLAHGAHPVSPYKIAALRLDAIA